MFQYEKSRERRKVKTSSPSQLNGYQHGSLLYSSPPPFPVSFYMLRVVVNGTNHEDRLLHVGFCLPKICSTDDIKLLIEETSKPTRKASIAIEKVRSSDHDFYIFEDTTFRILWYNPTPLKLAPINMLVFCVLLVVE